MSGHATYAVLDACFLLGVAAVGAIASVIATRREAQVRRSETGPAAASGWRRATLVTGLLSGTVLLVMTVVFDNVIVGLRIVAYDPARISGVRLGLLPIEDLAYALAAVVLLPSLAVLFAPRQHHDDAGVRPEEAGVRPDEGGRR